MDQPDIALRAGHYFSPVQLGRIELLALRANTRPAAVLEHALELLTAFLAHGILLQTPEGHHEGLAVRHRLPVELLEQLLIGVADLRALADILLGRDPAVHDAHTA